MTEALGRQPSHDDGNFIRVDVRRHVLVCLCDHHSEGDNRSVPLRTLGARLGALVEIPLSVALNVYDDNGDIVPFKPEGYAILKELAAINPIMIDACKFCGTAPWGEDRAINHHPTCLWIRAQAFKGAA